MIVNVPFLAPTSPPLTGASTKPTPSRVGEFLTEPVGVLGANSAGIDHDGARLKRFEQFVGEDTFQRCYIGQTGQHQVRPACCLRRRGATRFCCHPTKATCLAGRLVDGG